jgi:hypothetical protein
MGDMSEDDLAARDEGLFELWVDASGRCLAIDAIEPDDDADACTGPGRDASVIVPPHGAMLAKLVHPAHASRLRALLSGRTSKVVLAVRLVGGVWRTWDVLGATADASLGGQYLQLTVRDRSVSASPRRDPRPPSPIPAATCQH